jgi:hypothetical protein
MIKWMILLTLAFASEKTFHIEDTGGDVQIPTRLWELIQGNKPDQNLTFGNLKVRLEEKTEGTLVAPHLTIELPRGGGEIDLSKFVRDQKGTFRVFFSYDDFIGPKELNIYYISRARKRKIDGEVWGAGCKKFMDVKSYIESGKGIEVNTTRNRHLSVLGGIFIFSSGQQVSQVHFTDSTQTELFCGAGEG